LKITALQLGRTDFSQRFEICPEAEWNYEPELSVKDPEYDIAIIDRVLSDEESDILARIVRAHCLFVLSDVPVSEKMKFLIRSRCGKKLMGKDLETFLRDWLPNYYGRPYGEKFDSHSMSISPDFRGSICWHGYTEAVLKGDFGDGFKQIVFWKGNIPVEKNQAIDFWLEYRKEGAIEIRMEIIQFVSGSVSSVQDTWTFTEEDMKKPVTIEGREAGPVFVCLHARGRGTLRITSLHDRWSRRGVGTFFPGSRRMVTSDREEIFAYMDPGDLKPPLCVYFSGYKTMEGFEGYRMMRRMGCPFILVSETRLEGGAFYLGSQEYEDKLRNYILECMDDLGFNNDQVIFSGLSMGTFGALYYGTMIRPAYLIVGKPLVSLGNMAEAERLSRPGVFPTSLDVMWKQYGGLDQAAIDKMNQRFWDRFDKTDWSGRTMCAAYMIEDDYDMTAYQQLLSRVKGKGARVIGRGLHGRHNDDTSGIVGWFLRQYNRILRDEYDRKQN